MKRLIIAVVIIVASLGFSVWENNAVDNILSQLHAAIEEDAAEAFELWQEKKDFLGMFLGNEDIDALDVEMFALKNEIDKKDSDGISESCGVITGYIENIRQTERLSFGNVL